MTPRTFACAMAFAWASVGMGCAPAGFDDPTETSESALSSALPEGPVKLHLEGWGRGASGARGVAIKVVCDLTGHNPGSIDASCVVTAPYDGLGFTAKGTGDGNGARLAYDRSGKGYSGRYSESGDVGIAFMRRDDTVWARITASYESDFNWERRSFSTLQPALLTVIDGSAEPSFVETDDETCEHACAAQGQRCLSANASTARWVAFEGCPGLAPIPSTSASCNTFYTKRSGFSGEVCAFRLQCACI